MSGSETPIRVLMQQPALPAFRVPFFRALAHTEGIDFRLLYADSEVPTVDADGFLAEFREIKQLPGNLMWDGAHLAAMKAKPADVHILSWNTRYLSLVPAIWRAKRSGGGVICWGHGYSKNESPIRAWIRLQTAKMADAIILYSNSVAESYVKKGLPEDRVFVALNSLDPAPIQAARDTVIANPERQAQFCEDNGLEGPVLLYVSRLYPENRVEMLIDSTKDLLGEFPELKTVIIGVGPGLDAVKARAKELGVEDHVIFTGAVYGEENIAPWFAAADAFCYPENIGLSILHAMNHALPVVTSDKIEAQNPEIEALRDGENGLLYRDGDNADMTAKLRTLLSDKELHSKLSKEAHRTATEDYSTDKMAEGMEAAIRYVHAKAQSRAASR